MIKNTSKKDHEQQSFSIVRLQGCGIIIINLRNSILLELIVYCIIQEVIQAVFLCRAETWVLSEAIYRRIAGLHKGGFAVGDGETGKESNEWNEGIGDAYHKDIHQ